MGNIALRRSIISLAALLVKVTAKTPMGETCPVWISQAIRVVRTRVLPLPAPAKIMADWAWPFSLTGGRVTASRCSGLRFASKSEYIVPIIICLLCQMPQIPLILQRRTWRVNSLNPMSQPQLNLTGAPNGSAEGLLMPAWMSIRAIFLYNSLPPMSRAPFIWVMPLIKPSWMAWCGMHACQAKIPYGCLALIMLESLRRLWWSANSMHKRYLAMI